MAIESIEEESRTRRSWQSLPAALLVSVGDFIIAWCFSAALPTAMPELGVRKEMNILRAVVVSLLASAGVTWAEPHPSDTATVATACKVPATSVSRTVKLPSEDPSLKDRMLWIASYAFTQPVEFGITIACIPHGRLKSDSFDFIATKPELEYKKVELEDGSIIHHNLGDRGDQGTFYSTTLITKEGPYDFTLLITRKPGVKDSELPLDIKNAGIDLVQALTK